MAKQLTLKDLRKQLISTKHKSGNEKMVINLHNDVVHKKMDNLRYDRHKKSIQKACFKELEHGLNAHNAKDAVDHLKHLNKYIDNFNHFTHNVLITAGIKDVNQLIPWIKKHKSDNQ